ncbi:MAG TPA: endoribonuclease L-PSP, partial [Candidatus Latescibacteria bacterium]|nr:endoribonuclease L-PSP [Candidatus Latescibacterota bacterium]
MVTDPRERVTTGAVWESQVGYCRAVRSGDYICVSGTA